MVDFLSETGMKQPDPKRLLEIMFYRNFHSVGRKYELANLRVLGIKTVKILDCGDDRDYKTIKRFKKVWPIDQVPELPLPGCTAEYCRCSFIANNVLE